jgi:hypothetical protein
MISSNYLRPLRKLRNIPDRMLQHAGDTDACGTFTPEGDAPTALVIGARAPRLAVARLARRHGLQVEDLIAFQNSCTERRVSHG